MAEVSKPVDLVTADCCLPEQQTGCCQPADKAECCPPESSSCGCSAGTG
jgi:hypothetical protein